MLKIAECGGLASEVGGDLCHASHLIYVEGATAVAMPACDAV